MRRKILLDDRDIEIIAEARTKQAPPKLKKLAVIGFILIAVGGYLELNGVLYGFGIMGVGAVCEAIALIFTFRGVKKRKAEFIKAMKNTGETPSWPEE